MNISLHKNPYVSCVFRVRRRRSVSAMARNAGTNREKWNAIPVDSVNSRLQRAKYRDNGIARVLKFSDLIPPEKAFL